MVGYAKRDELADGVLGTYCLQFGTEHVLPASAPLLTALNIVREHTRAFILVLGRVGGIVTRGDFQKAPVRMWLFGLVTLVEMQLLQAILHGSPISRQVSRGTDVPVRIFLIPFFNPRGIVIPD